MRKTVAKISLFILIGIIISACDAVKRVPDGKYLLKKNNIEVDGKKEKGETISNLLYQQPNSTILGYPFRLNLYNIAKKNPDSSYKAMFLDDPKKLARQTKIFSAKQVQRKGQSFFYSGIHSFLKKTGEAPVIVDSNRTDKSLIRIKSHYFNNGYFNAKATYTVDTLSKKRAKINYTIIRGELHKIDSLTTKIASPALDSLYNKNKNLSALKTGDIFKSENFDFERERITTNFRNNGAFYFQQSNINFDIDTVDTGDKTNIKMIIDDQVLREGDSTITRPFKLYNVSEVNIYTDTPLNKSEAIVTDSVTYKGFNLYSYKKLKYRPKAITDAVFIAPDAKYSDIRTSVTSRYLSNLKVFNSPAIQYKLDPRDSLNNSLIANIYLTPRKKFSFGASLDFTHSNIQDFGISATTSVTIRNVFNGAETLDVALRGNIGSSRDFANPNNLFFNVSEYGIDTKLSFPRILMPFNTEKLIPKSTIPSTSITLGMAKQQNIGLDKENFTGAMTYNWSPRKNNIRHENRFDLFNVQYVNNVNIGNYFNVYKSSYNALNGLAQEYNTNPENVDDDGRLKIPEGADRFMSEVLGGSTSLSPGDADYRRINSISERKNRLSENNFILASSYTFSKTTKTNLADNNFYVFKTKVESAGNVLSLFGKAAETINDQNNSKAIFGLAYSQYIKTELEYVKHWDLMREKVFAVRTFFGIAIPYGNSTNIPFSRSYFAGGSNDIRAWQPYSLGPGSSGAINDFNEANLKITTSAELRFKIINSLKGAIFVDAGNIWNVLDDVEDEPSVFEGLKSLEDIAVGSGFGFRYDLSFFVIRLDLAFKTYIPSDDSTKKWFRDYNFGNSVLNIGINYPF
ncbi:MAG: outer membrane protein assembly factor [Flavobacterium sp.]|nr:MAG: outer membrane protein assembly factor [Flavobacterium sp.]